MEWAKVVSAVAIAGSSFALVAPAGAATIDNGLGYTGVVLEYDFTNPTFGSGAGTTANVVANGGSKDADLIGGTSGSNRPNLGATYNQPTGLGAGYDPRIQTGYIQFRDVAGTHDQALGTANSGLAPNPSTDHLLKQYMGTTNYDQGSVVVVFKPQASGLISSGPDAGKANARQTFFWSGSSNSSNNLVWLYNDDDQQGPTLRRNSGILASVDDYVYDPNTWYMLGASWRANTLGGAENVVYIRPLTENSTASFSVQNTFLLDGTVAMDQPVYVGYRADTLNDNANADMSLFALANASATVAQFDAIYASIAPVPEPALAGLMGLASTLLIGRRRA